MTALLAIIITGLVIFELVHGPVDQDGKRPLISCNVIIVGLFALYVVLPTILIQANGGKFVWAPSYGTPSQLQYALFMCLVALVSYMFGRRIFERRRSQFATPNRLLQNRARPRNSQATSESSRIVQLAYVLAFIGLALKLYLLFSEGGLSEAILRLSNDAQAATGVEALDSGAIGLRTFSSIADGAATWLVIWALKYKRRRTLHVAMFVVILGISYVTIGKRLALALPVLAVILAFSVYVRKISLRYAPLLFALALGAGMGSLLFRILLPATIAQENLDLTQVSYAGGSLVGFYLYSLEFSTVEMITVATQSASSINDLFGGRAAAFWTTQIEPFSYAIPRVFWPDKPDYVYDLSYGFSSVLNNGRVADATVGYASTLVGTAYVTAGVIGVVIAFIFLGWLVQRADKFFLSRPWSVASVAMYAYVLTVVFHFFRQGTLGWTFIVSTLEQIGFLAGLLILTLAAGRHARSIGNVSLDSRVVQGSRHDA